MINSRLFIRHYAVVAAIIVITSVILYQYTVPLIKSTTYEIEQSAGRNLLDVVHDLTNKIYLNIEIQRQLVLKSRKRELKNVIQLARAFIETIENDFNLGRITREEAYGRIYAGLKQFKYGNNDYIWAASHEGVLVSHPDPDFQGSDATVNPDLVEMIKIARQDGDGFYRYRWRRLGSKQDREKISYFQDFPGWGFIVGTGVYLEDVEADVVHRRKLAIDELRKALGNIRLSKTGYIYIFDANLNMLIHPNPNIDKTNFNQQVNPLSGHTIGTELIGKADDPNGLYYLWDRPEDPGNYIYEKISWVRHFKGFDWYIASSVYVDELRSNAEILGNRILAVASGSLFLALILSYIFIHRLLVPIRRMAATAHKVQTGDLTATSKIERNDEIGLLSCAFDSMIGRLRENIDTLDTRVAERTRELEVAHEKERQTESRLAEAQRMQTVGQLSGGLAHDFNNLLTVIIGNLAAAKDHYPDQSELSEYLDPALRASKRGAEITSRLLAFSRRQPLAPSVAAIDDLVADTIVLLGRSLPGHILIKLETGDQPCFANVDAGQLENALVNLAFNARDSMPKGGRLTFKVSLTSDTQQEPFDEPPDSADYVRIDVLDSGGGFTDKALHKAFEPFFTTKGGQAGSGLGLSMVYGFVKQSGGFIRLSNLESGGAQVSILLPQTHAPQSIEATIEPQEQLHQSWDSRLVLLVEDDSDVRKVVRRDLVSFGFSVLEASSADEAIPLVEHIDDLFMLVSDIITPGEISGTELAKLAVEQHPDLPVLLISGFTEESITQHLAGKVHFLRKPFDKQQLKSALCHLIKDGNDITCVETHDEQ